MACEHAAPWLMAFADGELGRWRRWRVGRHVAGCAACERRVEELRAMSSALHEQLSYHRAPPGLAARIGTSLAREPGLAPPRRLAWPTMNGAWLGGAGLGGALAGVALMLALQAGPSQPMLSALVDSQVRSLMAEHLMDVPTSDRHTVKPWLSARVDVSPPVRDLSAEGFTLVGGRLDYVDGHRAAVVVYRRAKHIINLYAWAVPGPRDSGPRASELRGFNVVSWRQDGVAYHAVSDLEADQLMTFARDIAEGT